MKYSPAGLTRPDFGIPRYFIRTYGALVDTVSDIFVCSCSNISSCGLGNRLLSCTWCFCLRLAMIGLRCLSTSGIGRPLLMLLTWVKFRCICLQGRDSLRWCGLFLSQSSTTLSARTWRSSRIVSVVHTIVAVALAIPTWPRTTHRFSASSVFPSSSYPPRSASSPWAPPSCIAQMSILICRSFST